MNTEEKRITMKLKHPNPLFEKWLTEWRDEAKQRDSKMQHCFAKALKSLKKYPLPLERGRDCKILDGFGDRLCQMLDEKLDQYNTHQFEHSKSLDNAPENIENITKRKINPPTTKTSTSPKRNKKEYIPSYRSGAYAILIVLYENSLINVNNSFMKKDEIILKGANLCDKSFTKADPGSYYTAWSSMKTLVDKQLVLKQGNPPKFSLTTSGTEIARKLYENDVVDLMDSQNTDNKINEHINQNVEVSSKEVHIDKYPSVSNNKSSQGSSKSGENFVTNCETVLFAPNTFEVILVVDKQETCGSKEKVQNDPILSELTHLNIPYDVKHLKVGDYTWICKDKTSDVELVLPYVIERKRMDDFGSSIKDGRYYEQKFRLKQCGIQNVIYLIESHGDNTHTCLPLSTLYQAATNTLLQDGFIVKFSEGLRGTAHYLNCMTKILKGNYESKTLMSCPKANLEKSTIDDDLIPLMTFKEFNQSGSKYKNFTASEMFIKHLVQLKGLSIDKALAIVEKYPTPKLFKRACDEDIENTEKTIANIQFGKKKRVGPAISSTLCKFYTLKQFD